MKRSILLSIAFLCLFCSAAFAENFDVKDARRVLPKSEEYQLTYTHYSEGAIPDAYVFTKGSEKGFTIVSARGDEPLILGYSDDCDFDPSDIPPALQTILESYSTDVELAPSSRSDRPSIEPLCATKWGQGEPYNYFCPVIGSKKAVTGCAPTAMAQIMKYYNYPECGEGSNSYSYMYNGHSRGLSMDFSEVNFQWKYMTNTYGGVFFGTTSEFAVARLMQSCGIASEAIYNPEGTGTEIPMCLSALIKYFKYDKSLSIQFREWYEDVEWEQLVYDELAQNRPIWYYGANNAHETAHAFICDGYSSGGYYHFNWGWDGKYDGYYLLSALKPKLDFSDSQAMGIGIKPDECGEKNFDFSIRGKLQTDKQSYSLTGIGYYGSIKLRGHFASCCLLPSDVQVGIKIIDGKFTDYMSLTYANQLKCMDGFNELTIYSKNLPVGEYDVYPVARLKGSNEWKEMRYDIRYSNHLHFVVTKDRIDVTTPVSSIESVTVEDKAAVRYFNLMGVPVSNPENGVFIKVEGTKRSKVRL
ncbi:MAG: C10 family peptidase [Muribaculaceae bacterium]|nr:C10 family peptidase [Muribaculaceae bacterium]